MVSGWHYGQGPEDASRLLTTQMTNTIGEARVAWRKRMPRPGPDSRSLRDLKTSLICITRDGKRFTADTHEPIGHTIPYLSGIPYHPN